MAVADPARTYVDYRPMASTTGLCASPLSFANLQLFPLSHYLLCYYPNPTEGVVRGQRTNSAFVWRGIPYGSVSRRFAAATPPPLRNDVILSALVPASYKEINHSLFLVCVALALSRC